MAKTFKIVGEDMSDGYHTFDELYDHRCALFVALCMTQPARCAWKYDEGIADWFILYLESPKGRISYHVPLKRLDTVRSAIRQDQGHEWDGHKSADVLERLAALAATDRIMEIAEQVMETHKEVFKRLAKQDSDVVILGTKSGDIIVGPETKQTTDDGGSK